ncbi:hypothetical protein C8Q77DRAFT_1083741 [Trametes polyzona]|nr:hypothetical protein C8Q77DRAFT_1083741 [Trametes polyzona]
MTKSRRLGEPTRREGNGETVLVAGVERPSVRQCASETTREWTRRRRNGQTLAHWRRSSPSRASPLDEYSNCGAPVVLLPRPHIDVIARACSYIIAALLLPSSLTSSSHDLSRPTRFSLHEHHSSTMGAIFSAIGGAINAVVSAIADIIMIIVSVIVTVRIALSFSVSRPVHLHDPRSDHCHHLRHHLRYPLLQLLRRSYEAHGNPQIPVRTEGRRCSNVLGASPVCRASGCYTLLRRPASIQLCIMIAYNTCSFR